MNIETEVGEAVSAELLLNYFRNLVNQIYKILPMREKGIDSLGKFIWRLEAELVGNRDLIEPLRNDAYYGSLLGILHYLCECGDECSVEQVKHLVFEGISICEKLQKRYAGGGE